MGPWFDVGGQFAGGGTPVGAGTGGGTPGVPDVFKMLIILCCSSACLCVAGSPLASAEKKSFSFCV